MTDMGSDGVTGSDRVTGAAEELYAADPAGFTQRRQALAAANVADPHAGLREDIATTLTSAQLITTCPAIHR